MGEENKTDEIASRILDAAERLILRYGYDKTSLEDIARETGIARSTLYGRWKKKEDLGTALIWRASRRYLIVLLDRIEADPSGGTFAGMFHNAMLVLTEDAFLLALYRREHHLPGSLLRRPDIEALYIQRIETLKQFLRMMQQAGTVRPDIDVDALALILSSLQYGYIKMTGFVSDEQALSADRVLKVSSEMIDRYIASPGSGDSEAGKVAIRQYFEIVFKQLDELEGTVRQAVIQNQSGG